MRENRLWHVIPVQTTYWEINFDLTLLKRNDKWSNILKCVHGKNNPSFFLDDDNKLKAIYCYNDQRRDKIFNQSLPIGVKKNIRFVKRKSNFGTNHVIQLFVDGQVVDTGEHPFSEDVFTNVKCYISAPSRVPTPALIANLKYTQDDGALLYFRK